MKDAKGFAKGAMIGMAAGAALSMAGRMLMSGKKHHVQKGSAKAVKAVGDFVEGIQTIIR
ncbi:MAG: hypothetical protein UIG59_08750 [Acutalibacteraceae bacterium]|nr:hypothetical protein [Acutalibacteraceae bacterium]